MAKEPIILTDQIIPQPALVRAGLEMLPAAIAAHGERAGRRFIEFFTATIRNRNTRMAYARAGKTLLRLVRRPSARPGRHRADRDRRVHRGARL
jgi:hypothetical protein